MYKTETIIELLSNELNDGISVSNYTTTYFDICQINKLTCANVVDCLTLCQRTVQFLDLTCF